MTVHNEALRDHACLIVHGPDQPGLVAAVTGLITRHKANIVSLDQYSDNPEGGAFFQRLRHEVMAVAGILQRHEQIAGAQRPGVDGNALRSPVGGGTPAGRGGGVQSRSAISQRT